jgi:hypothetical protein
MDIKKFNALSGKFNRKNYAFYIKKKLKPLLSTKNFLDSLMDLHHNQLVIRRKVNEKQKCSGYYFDIEFCGSKYCRKRKTFQDS